jgi:hypothetical protein
MSRMNHGAQCGRVHGFSWCCCARHASYGGQTFTVHMLRLLIWIQQSIMQVAQCRVDAIR